ncbi:hypothetical protein EHO60_11375 [Leptospira fletcheri]|uniref:Uncharacterized protein n=1 Tax=Leptospira fletcheri TaxID=2484981 RepID=A0A4R9GDX4_9LEPT|nr:hypothetical protein [Leptospira fletcheri]TGK09953.1 hypothetical protein EHO60_11375 [Leptospira fletcheri]
MNVIKALLRPIYRFYLNFRESKNANLNAPVTQIFINDEKRKTNFSITNYPSFLLPKLIGSIWYEISLSDQEGNLLFSKDVKLPKYGSLNVDIAAIYSGPLPPRGLFYANLKASRLSFIQKYYLRRLGKLTSHFYTFYHSSGYESLAMVHPQTVAPVPISGPKSNFWYSQFLLKVQAISALELFQMNPSQRAEKLKIIVMNMLGEEVVSSEELVPALGVRRVVFDQMQLGNNEYVYIASDTLRGNEKPILFSHYSDGTYTALHT